MNNVSGKVVFSFNFFWIYITHFIILYETLTKPFDPGLLSILIIQIVKTQKITSSFKILKSSSTL